MISNDRLKKMPLQKIKEKFPFSETFFENNGLDVKGFETKTFIEYLQNFSEEEREELAIDTHKLEDDFIDYMEQMIEFMGIEDKDTIDSLTILPGKNKSGEGETFGEFTINKSEIVAIVGPTGSGKSRLLADIEWTANKDTPTDRTILINGEIKDKDYTSYSYNSLVAQLSQNMNFVMDLSVKDFLSLHAKSRMVEDRETVIEKIIDAANNLAGEKFDLNTQITNLSGGQSRALMIADTAILSSSPIVLIDEIENAGIDRKKALDLLVSEEKIVLMATHDPSLALIADKRIVIRNGGIYRVIQTDSKEKQILKELEKMDKKINGLRAKLRKGEILENL